MTFWCCFRKPTKLWPEAVSQSTRVYICWNWNHSHYLYGARRGEVRPLWAPWQHCWHHWQTLLQRGTFPPYSTIHGPFEPPAAQFADEEAACSEYLRRRDQLCEFDCHLPGVCRTKIPKAEGSASETEVCRSHVIINRCGVCNRQRGKLPAGDRTTVRSAPFGYIQYWPFRLECVVHSCASRTICNEPYHLCNHVIEVQRRVARSNQKLSIHLTLANRSVTSSNTRYSRNFQKWWKYISDESIRKTTLRLKLYH